MGDDPISWLTKFLTTGKENPDEKTRVMTKEQKTFTLAYQFVGSKEGLNMPFYQTIADMDMRLMMSYQGKRSDDVVIALSKLKTEEEENVGIQPLKQYFKEKEHGRS